MEMNLNENADRTQAIKKEINTILENWRGLYSKEHTSIVEAIKKYARRKPFMSNDEYAIWCLCKVEGKEAFRAIYNEYKKPFEKDEFVRIQKNAFLNRLENDCRKISWYLDGITTNDKVYPILKEVQCYLARIGSLLEEALEQAWEENQMAF